MFKELFRSFLQWLRPVQLFVWRRRKILLPLALLVAVLEAIYFVWVYLPLFVVLLLAFIVVGTFWIHQAFDKVTLVALIENAWLAIVATGAVVFLVQNSLALHFVVLVFGLLAYLIFRAQAGFRETGVWETNDIPRLQLAGLLGFFVSAAVALNMASFYLAGPWLVLLILGLSSSLFAWFNFRRINLPRERGVFLVAVFIAIIEEVAWLMFNWEAGTLFKAFLLTSFYFLYFELLTQYYRGSLTIKVVTQYAMGTAIILFVLFIANSVVGLM